MAQQVTVTGGTGFIAGWLIFQLLEKGYRVHTTCRSKTSPKTQHLLRLADALPGTLTLFEADLLTPGSFNDAVRGSSVVFHTASPVTFQVSNPQEALVDPAVKGTRNVLAAAAASRDTVRRVVVTSSFAAIRSRAAWLDGRQVPRNGQVFTEEDFNEFSGLEDEAYFVSKVEAEKVAWEWSKEQGISVITLNPSLVIGPVLCPTDAETPKFLKSVVEGTVPHIFTTFVDVRDVARAHVLAAEIPTASGRYLVGARTAFNGRWLCQTLRARFPEYELPEGEATHEVEVIDNSKVQRELGLHFRPMTETVIDGVTTMVACGMVVPRVKA